MVVVWITDRPTSKGAHQPPMRRVGITPNATAYGFGGIPK